jgi:hypothetical protein
MLPTQTAPIFKKVTCVCARSFEQSCWNCSEDNLSKLVSLQCTHASSIKTYKPKLMMEGKFPGEKTSRRCWGRLNVMFVGCNSHSRPQAPCCLYGKCPEYVCGFPCEHVHRGRVRTCVALRSLCALARAFTINVPGRRGGGMVGARLKKERCSFGGGGGV